MHYRRILVAALVLAGVGVAIPTVFADQSSTPKPTRLARPSRVTNAATAPQFDSNTVLVRFKKTASAAAVDKALSSRQASQVRALPGGSYVKVHTAGDAATTAAALRKDPAVESVSLDYKRDLAAVPNDEFYAAYQQSYLSAVRLPQAWDVIKDAPAQVIAVVDTGVDTGHPDLAGRTVAGYNVITPGSAPVDTIGHGTMVAGIAAANTNNVQGVAGAAWNGRIMPIRVFPDSGGALDSDIATGIVWAADHGAKIINLSLGGPGDSTVLHDAIIYANNLGVLVVAAAGNDSDDTPQYPAAYSEVVAVSATDSAGTLVDFSSWGGWIDVAAPGFEITSTHPAALGFDYGTGDGTSFAAPIVAGVAALVRAKFPTLTPAQVAERLRTSARDAGPRGIDPYYGYGVLDAYRAVGGAWAADFPQPALGAGEPNDVPARATAISGTMSGNIDIEGDVDWYSYTAAADGGVTITVTPASFDPFIGQNADPVLELYDEQLTLLGRVDNASPGNAEVLDATLVAGLHYVAVRNFNGARDTRAYSLSVASSAGAPVTGTDRFFVEEISPSDFATSIALSATPTVQFTTDLLAASVTVDTVKLLHGMTGAVVETTPSYDAASRTATLTPTAPLQDNTPYRIVVSDVEDLTGILMPAPFSTTFRTVNQAPVLSSFTSTGAVGAVNLSWTMPAITDLDQVIVRMATGTTVPPATPTVGTLVYSGTGTSARISGLNSGSRYAFSIWVKDRTGLYSARRTGAFTGTAAIINLSATAMTYSGTVTITGRVTRTDTGAGLSRVQVKLYGRALGTTSWVLLNTVQTTPAGYLTATHRPSTSIQYRWEYPGSSGYMGSTSAIRGLGLHTKVVANLSATTVRLGSSVVLSGYVNPIHAGKTVYLQRLVNGTWVTGSARTLSATSTFSYTIKPGARGKYTYRIYMPGDTDHLYGISSAKVLTIT